MTIKELLADRGLTIDDLAGSIGIDKSILTDYVEGKVKPSGKALAVIMEACGADEDLDIQSLESELAAEALAEPAEVIEIAAEEADDAAAEAEVTKAEAAEEADDAAAEAEAAEEEAAEEADDTAAEAEAVEEEAAEEADDAAAEAEAAEEADDAAVEAEVTEAEAAEEAGDAAAAEEAARKAAEEKAARKAAKKAAKKRKADEEAAQWVAEAIRALGDAAELSDGDVVIAARDAYDSLTYDQEQLIPGDLLSLLVAAEQKIEDASKTFPIEDCWITVKDVAYTGKKIKKPSVKVECGDMKLKEGEDYSVSYDKKARDIGLYTLTVKGKGRFTGSVDVPFCVIPKAKALVKMMVGDKQSGLDWKWLKHITGCQIEYSLDKDLSGSSKEKISKPKDLKRLAKKLKAGKKYYVRVRIYATVKKKKVYSDWSKVKPLKL
ncbi:MAG: helix-turn-helix transcriptional regulator [Clostridia bacterium]|nr:helix-turn-helix transcriptional regulator [Clostridia bacterium]